MPPSKFEASRGVKRASFSLFTLASSCANAYFRAYAIIDFIADRLVFLNTVTNIQAPIVLLASTDITANGAAVVKICEVLHVSVSSYKVYSQKQKKKL